MGKDRSQSLETETFDDVNIYFDISSLKQIIERKKQEETQREDSEQIPSCQYFDSLEGELRRYSVDSLEESWIGEESVDSCDTEYTTDSLGTELSEAAFYSLETVEAVLTPETRSVILQANFHHHVGCQHVLRNCQQSDQSINQSECYNVLDFLMYLGTIPALLNIFLSSFYRQL